MKVQQVAACKLLPDDRIYMRHVPDTSYYRVEKVHPSVGGIVQVDYYWVNLLCEDGCCGDYDSDYYHKGESIPIWERGSYED